MFLKYKFSKSFTAKCFEICWLDQCKKQQKSPACSSKVQQDCHAQLQEQKTATGSARHCSDLRPLSLSLYFCLVWSKLLSESFLNLVIRYLRNYPLIFITGERKIFASCFKNLQVPRLLFAPLLPLWVCHSRGHPTSGHQTLTAKGKMLPSSLKSHPPFSVRLKDSSLHGAMPPHSI